MMKRFIPWLLIAVLLLPTGVALAGDVTDATREGILQISNNGTDASNVAVPFELSTQALITGGYCWDNMTNTNIQYGGADVPYMPSYNGSDNWSVFVDSIGENRNINYDFYAGGASDMVNYLRYFPGDDGMSTDDSATLELTDNWTIYQESFIDTSEGANKNLVYKEEAFAVAVTNSGNITAGIPNSQWISPTGFVDGTGAWSGEPNAYDNVLGTDASDAAVPAGSWSEWLELTHAAINCDKVRFYADTAGGNVDQIDLDVYYGETWNDLYQGAYTSENWEEKTLADNRTAVTSARVRFHNDGGVPLALNISEFDFYDVELTFSSTQVSATGISSGEYSANVSAYPLIWATDSDLHFDGTVNSYVDCGITYNGTANLWQSFWFKPDADFPAGAPHHFYLASKPLNDTNRLALFLSTTTGQVAFMKATGGANDFLIYSTETSWTADTWYHVLASTSAANGVRLRINGGAAITDPDVSAMTNGGHYWIGNYDGALGAWSLIGEIANFCTGTDDLSATEETNLYNNTFPGDEVDLWYMDEGTGTAITSYGSGSNDGTAGAANTWLEEERPCKLAIAIDGTSYDGFARPATVPNTPDDWYFLQNDSMLYLERQRIWINSVLQQDIVWESDTTFTDGSGNGHDATPTFRETSSDPDVSAELISFTPTSMAILDEFNIETDPALVETAPAESTHMYTEMDTSHFPGSTWINERLLDAYSIPRTIFWFPFAFSLAIGIGFIIYKPSKSLLAQAIASGFVIGFFASTGIVPAWVMIPFAIEAAGVLLWQRTFGI